MDSLPEPEVASARPAAPPLSSPPLPDRTTRRWPAMLLSLLAPGLGHLAIGHPRRMVAWFATLLAIVALTIVGSLAGAPATILVAPIAGVLLRLASAVDTIGLERSRPLPRPRAVLLIMVGLFAFWNIVALGVRSRVIEAFVVPSAGMYPTVEVGERIFATKLDRTYRAGDVVVVRDPRDRQTQYIKRIVAVGGDRVAVRVGSVLLNGQPIARRQTDRPCVSSGSGACSIWEETLGGRRYLVAHEDYQSPDFEEVTVPAGSFFLLGDNRENSMDSRQWGPIEAALVNGKVTGIWWSRRDVSFWERVNLRIE